MVLNGWFYLTPIVYPLDMVPERFRGIIEANPLSHLVALSTARPSWGRSSYRRWGSGGWRCSPAWCWWWGLALFRRLRPAFVDEI